MRGCQPACQVSQALCNVKIRFRSFPSPTGWAKWRMERFGPGYREGPRLRGSKRLQLLNAGMRPRMPLLIGTFNGCFELMCRGRLRPIARPGHPRANGLATAASPRLIPAARGRLLPFLGTCPIQKQRDHILQIFSSTSGLKKAVLCPTPIPICLRAISLDDL